MMPSPNLPGHLKPPGQAFFILPEGFDVIVQKAHGAHPQRGNEHQDHVDVLEPGKQQRRNHRGGNDDDPAHGGGSFFLQLPFQAQVAHLFAHLLAPQDVDQPLAKGDGDQQRQERSHPRPERDELKQARPR